MIAVVVIKGHAIVYTDNMYLMSSWCPVTALFLYSWWEIEIYIENTYITYKIQIYQLLIDNFLSLRQ